MDNNNLSFEIESEIDGIKTCKDAIDFFEKDINNISLPTIEIVWIKNIIDCLKDFDKTRTLKSIANIKNSFTDIINENGFYTKYIEKDSIYYMICFYIRENKELDDYNISIHKVDGLLLNIDTGSLEKTYPILTKIDYDILIHLDLAHNHYLCCDNGGIPYLMRSMSHPLKNSDLNSEEVPDNWLSDIDGYDNRIKFKGDVFSFINFFSDKCYNKNDIHDLILEYESHVTKVLI